MAWPAIINLRGNISMNSTNNQAPSGLRFSEPGPYKCFVCNDPVGDRCFCKLFRKEGGPILLCCPSCVIQSLDSSRPPADRFEEEMRAYEKNTHFFIGEDKPWS